MPLGQSHHCFQGIPCIVPCECPPTPLKKQVNLLPLNSATCDSAYYHSFVSGIVSDIPLGLLHYTGVELD